MGKIKTRGFAKREVEYDRMKIRLDFYAAEQTTGEAIRSVSDSCEAFLGKLEELGLAAEKIRSAGDAVSHDMYTEREQARASRAIEFTAEYDLALIDRVKEAVAEGSFRADMSVEPVLSKEAEIREELIKEAIADARRSADLIAESTGTRVVGIDEIQTDRRFDLMADMGAEEDALLLSAPAAGAMRKKFADLGNPVTEQQAEIFIEWKIEDQAK